LTAAVASRPPAVLAAPWRRRISLVIEARLLLVDDDVPHLDALAERLTGDGFEVARASSAREALEQLDAAWPDLVILDLLMPGMDGQTLAGRIKSRADLPILVLSPSSRPTARRI